MHFHSNYFYLINLFALFSIQQGKYSQFVCFDCTFAQFDYLHDYHVTIVTCVGDSQFGYKILMMGDTVSNY